MKPSPANRLKEILSSPSQIHCIGYQAHESRALTRTSKTVMAKVFMASVLGSLPTVADAADILGGSISATHERIRFPFSQDQDLFDAFYKSMLTNEGGHFITVDDRSSGKKRMFKCAANTIQIETHKDGWRLTNPETNEFHFLRKKDFETDRAIVTVSGIEISHLKKHGSLLNLEDIQRITGDPGATLFHFNAKPIYREMYWHAGFNKLDRNLALVLADIGFHHEVDNRDAMLSSVVNDIGNGYRINPLVGMSKNDFAVVNGLEPGAVIAGLANKCLERYEYLADQKANRQYAEGWRNRAESYLQMAGAQGERAYLDAQQNSDTAREAAMNQESHWQHAMSAAPSDEPPLQLGAGWRPYSDMMAEADEGPGY